VGAIYLDLGMVHAKNFVLKSFTKVKTSLVDDNYKDQLMRWCQALKYPLPDYRLDNQFSNGQFHITVVVDGMECAAGFALTKKQAEQNAAEIVLKTDIRFKNKKIPVNGKDSESNQGAACG
jgi:ribonuclease-3